MNAVWRYVLAWSPLEMQSLMAAMGPWVELMGFAIRLTTMDP